MFPEIFHSASGKLIVSLSWTHSRILLKVSDTKARDLYAKEALEHCKETFHLGIIIVC